MVYARLLLIILGTLHALAAWFYFSKQDRSWPWAVAWVLLTALCVWELPDHPWLTGGAFLAALVAWTWWWSTLHVVSARGWLPDDARQATAEIDETRLRIRDVRNFDWHGPHDFTPAWEDREYALTSLTAIDLFVCTWGSPHIAHLIVSFVFSDSAPLAFSIETRRTSSERWSMLAWFMKAYGLILIAADERDVVRVRTNIRGERVLRFRILSTPVMRARLLTRYVDELNALARRPLFYNTLFRNCTTEVVRLMRAAGRRVPLDWRLLVSGHVPEYLYDHRMISTEQPFADLAAAADIGARARAAGDTADFSSRIRAG